MKKNIRVTKKRIAKIRQLMSKARSPYRGMTKQGIIDEIRKIRAKLWEKKLAAHS